MQRHAGRGVGGLGEKGVGEDMISNAKATVKLRINHNLKL